MSDLVYYVLSALLSALVLLGLAMQSRVKSAVRGNLICVGVMGLAILLTLYKDAALGNPLLWLSMAVGAVIGLLWAARVKMIEMPQTVALLRGACDEDLRYLLHAQMLEADLIVLNKCDLSDAARRAADAEYLQARYPEAKVLCISARTGEGLEALSDALTAGRASLRNPDLGYGGAQFKKSMKRVSEYYLQYRAVVCCDDFDGNAYLAALAGRVRDGVAAAGCEIPHLKLLAWTPEGDFGKVDLLGVGRPVERTRPFARRCVDLAVILNASALCPHKTLDAIVTGAAEEVSAEYRLEMTVFKKEHFGMG